VAVKPQARTGGERKVVEVSWMEDGDWCEMVKERSWEVIESRP
jgi:hypothetical protein